MLFAKAAPLTAPVAGTSGFAAQFAAQGPRDKDGRSLRELDLKTRLFRYPCSFLIYSDAFDALPISEQQRVFGRTKPDSVEFEGPALPVDAHIARTQIEDASGEEIPIYRRSVPYGTIAEHGLQFIAFAADRARLDRMLARMFGMAEDGVHDRLTDFSRPVTGAYYYAPSLTFLAAQAETFDRADTPAGENRPGIPMGLPPT